MARWRTRWVRAGWTPSRDPKREPVVPPIFVSAIYVNPAMSFERVYPRVGDLKYSRENNPTVLGFEEAVASLEGGSWALAFNSGMSAISTVLILMASLGVERLALMRLTYGSTRSLVSLLSRSVKRLSVEVVGPPWDDLIHAASRCEAALIESMANPTLRVPPLSEVLKEARSSGCTVIVDNTFATPVAYRPLENGAPLVVESVTKYISGHNDVVGGIVAGLDRDLLERLWDARRLLGTMMQPLDAYMAWRGMKTLVARFELQSKSAAEVASWLENHRKVKRVYYPGLPSHPDHDIAKKEFNGVYGAVIGFEIEGGRDAVFRLLSKLELVTPSPSFGGVESIVSYPAISSHSSLEPSERHELGITDGLLRLSVGLEDVADIIDDLSKALNSI